MPHKCQKHTDLVMCWCCGYCGVFGWDLFENSIWHELVMGACAVRLLVPGEYLQITLVLPGKTGAAGTESCLGTFPWLE